MKTTILSIACVLFGAGLMAQTNNNLVVYTEQGEKFTVILNGVRQNPKPETNVKVTGLNNSNMKMKVIFDDKSIPDLDQTVYFMNGGEAVSNYELTYAVIKKGTNYKARFRDAVPIASVPANPTQTTVVYTTTAPAPDPVVTSGTTVTTTTTTTGTAAQPTGDNVSIGMNIGGMGVNMNVNVNDGTNMNTNVNTTSSSTTTYTTTTTTTSSGTGMGTGSGTATSTQYVLPGYSGPYGCPYPMSSQEFESAKQSIKSKSFDDTRLTLAKQIINSNCMLSGQVKEIMLLFSFEATRLDLAKYSYKKTLDQGNYYKLNDAFTFESSIDDLNKYIEANK